jgi:hypothetical protein
MATPIKPTPILTGADSRRFAKAMENVKKISPEKREEMQKAYEWFKRAAKFPLRHEISIG